MKLPILIAMVLYMAIVVWIGVFYSRKTKTSEDYFLGGRGLGPWVTAMSAEASDMSSWLLMGLPGLAYATGFSQAGWTAIGLILGTYLNWKIVAKRLRHYTEVADNAITVPDFFSNRFKDDKKILSSISAVMILIFFTVYTASGFAACGKLFNSLFGVDYLTAMIISAIVIVAYTTLGGFLAASTSDSRSFFRVISFFLFCFCAEVRQRSRICSLSFPSILNCFIVFACTVDNFILCLQIAS